MHTPSSRRRKRAYLVEVDDGLPEVVLLLVEVPHTDLTEVTRMVLVEVRSVVVLTTSQTSTTWMLAVLSYTTVSGGDVAAAVEITEVSNPFFLSLALCIQFPDCNPTIPIPTPKPSAASRKTKSPTRQQQQQQQQRPKDLPHAHAHIERKRRGTYCLRVLLRWVGILSSSGCRNLLSSRVYLFNSRIPRSLNMRDERR
jgi:hypothetical protein